MGEDNASGSVWVREGRRNGEDWGLGSVLSDGHWSLEWERRGGGRGEEGPSRLPCPPCGMSGWVGLAGGPGVGAAKWDWGVAGEQKGQPTRGISLSCPPCHCQHCRHAESPSQLVPPPALRPCSPAFLRQRR